MHAPASAKTEPRSTPGCPSDEALLSYLPGLLSDGDAAVVHAHLQDCPSCQSRITTLKKRISTEGNGNRAAGPAIPDKKSDPTAATTAYVPTRRRMPKQLGPYQVLGPIGRGGMGQVFKGYHPRLQRTVAIKLLLGLHLADNTAVIRLQREQAAAGRVEHDNIVYAFDAGEQDGVDYLVMEYVEGVDLGRLIAEGIKVSIADACEIARQAALGLAHIESCGLVHRDIKPSNLMLSTGGVVKILDLGLAKLREGPIDDADATHSGFLLGTADYIAPEQIDTPREVDVRSDLYSLGCTLFKLLAGRAPFSDEQHSTVTSKIDAHRRESPPAIRTLRPDVPEALEHLLGKLLAKPPTERLQHPDELAASLSEWTIGADLKSLAAQASHRPPAESLPAEESPAGSDSDASTQPQGHTPTPNRVSTRPLASWWPPAAVAAAVVAAALLLAPGMWASLTGGNTVEDAPASVSPVVQFNSEPATFDLRQPLDEIVWPGFEPSTVKPLFDEDVRMLEVRPDSFRFIKLGTYDGRSGTFAVKIRQAPWRGYAGLFFGYRLVPTPRVPKVATYQLFMIKADPPLPIYARGKPLEVFISRSRAWIDVPVQFQEDFPVDAKLARVPDLDIDLEVRFEERRCTSVRVNGEPLELLCLDELNKKFGDEDYLGPWGLYVDTGLGNQNPTWFGNVVFTPFDGE